MLIIEAEDLCDVVCLNLTSFRYRHCLGLSVFCLLYKFCGQLTSFADPPLL